LFAIQTSLIHYTPSGIYLRKQHSCHGSEDLDLTIVKINTEYFNGLPKKKRRRRKEKNERKEN
jgi:hypothetical protein